MASRRTSPHCDRMTTRIDPIADGIHRISTFVADGPPGGITFNQFLVLGDEPLLVHTGMRGTFPAVRDAVATMLDPAGLRWISSCHASRPDSTGRSTVEATRRPMRRRARFPLLLCLDYLSSPSPRISRRRGAGLGGRGFDGRHPTCRALEAGGSSRRNPTRFCRPVRRTVRPSHPAEDTSMRHRHDQLIRPAVTASTGRRCPLAELEPRRALSCRVRVRRQTRRRARCARGYFDPRCSRDRASV